MPALNLASVSGAASHHAINRLNVATVQQVLTVQSASHPATTVRRKAWIGFEDVRVSSFIGYRDSSHGCSEFQLECPFTDT